MPSHFIGILSLGPCILFYFFRGSTPLLATAGGNHDERLSFQSFHHSNFGCVFVTLYLFGFRTQAWQKTGFIAQRPTRVEVFTGAIRQEIPRYVRVNPRCESFRLGYHVGLMKHHLWLWYIHITSYYIMMESFHIYICIYICIYTYMYFLSFWAIWSSAARQRDTWNSDAILHGPLHVSEAQTLQ